MPSPQDLQRLRGLLTQLSAIGNARRGELIRAEDWNALVDAVADVARVVLAVDATEVVPQHEHLDQVTLAWLSPPLRDLLERGPLADPAAQQRLLDLELRLRRLSEQLEASRTKVDEVRGRLTDVVSRDLEREAAVTRVRRAVESVADPRSDVLELRSTLASVQRYLGRVSQAAAQLSVNGQVVDLGGVVNRLGELEQLRDRLRLASGELLDAATIEQRLAEVTNRTVTPEDLDAAIRGRPAAIPPEAIAGIEDRLGTSLRTQVNSSLEAFGSDLRADVASRLNGVGSLVDARVGDALPVLTETLTGRLAAAIETAQRDAVAAAVASANRQLQGREEAIRGDLAAAIGDLRSSIAPAVRSELAGQVRAELDSVRADLARLADRVGVVAGSTGRNAELLEAHSAALARVPQDVAAIRNELRQSLNTEFELRDAATRRTLDERLGTFDRTQGERFDLLSVEVRTLVAVTAQKIATQTALDQVRDLRAQLLAEIRGVAREEVGVAVRDSVRVTVNDAVRDRLGTVETRPIGLDIHRVSPNPISG